MDSIDSLSFGLMFSSPEAGTRELLNYLRTRQFVGTDKLGSNYRDVQFNSGRAILLTLLLTKKEGSKLQISAELHRVDQRAESLSQCTTTCSEGQDHYTVTPLLCELGHRGLPRL